MAYNTNAGLARRVADDGARRIAVIGGFDRQAPLLTDMARRSGHTVEFHTGNVRGRGTTDLRGIVARSDVVVIVTDHNSHGGVHEAKRLAREFDRPAIVVTRCGPARFGMLLDTLSIPARDARTPGAAVARA